jgi:hypothetical protein
MYSKTIKVCSITGHFTWGISNSKLKLFGILGHFGLWLSLTYVPRVVQLIYTTTGVDLELHSTLFLVVLIPDHFIQHKLVALTQLTLYVSHLILVHVHQTLVFL